ncbi:hypothetical protein NX059_000702 [Plenodomus lindquistii]|nr:hypothetical protein NX059_000702 [Plenodomus lindquistii]
MHIVTVVLVSFRAGLGLCRVVERGHTAVNKPVFAHYVIGEIDPDHVLKDIQDAKAIGIDGFAMNFGDGMWFLVLIWANTFQINSEGGFGLFFSFDSGAGKLGTPTTYVSYLRNYTIRTSYYFYKDKPLVSTFGGEDINWADFKKVADFILIPGFSNAAASTTFFSDHPNLNGVFNWNSWPNTSEGVGAVVSSANDAKFNTVSTTPVATS